MNYTIYLRKSQVQNENSRLFSFTYSFYMYILLPVGASCARDIAKKR